MKKMLSVGLLLTLWVSLWNLSIAQAPTDYYKSAYNKGGYSLKTALSQVIDNHKVVSYSGLWEAFEETDIASDGKVWDIYSECGFTFGSEQCGNYKNECDCYNREHSFPKSWFNDAKPMYSDLFHLYPTDGKVNGMRSNHPYGEVSSPTYTSQTGCKVGKNTTSGYSGTVFEPRNEYKGDLARSYFYMATRYESNISNWNSDMLNHTSNQAFSDWAVALLVKWHQQDPVSKKEIDRNNAIYTYQNNRNPFIDHPELVNKIWGNDTKPWNGSGDTNVEPPHPQDTTVFYTLSDLLSRSSNTTTVYTYKGVAVVTMIGTQRGQKFLQDATAAIMIDDATSKITTSFEIGEYITDIAGKWYNYNGLIEFIPERNAEKTTGSYRATPYTLTLSNIADKDFMNTVQSRLINVKKVSFADEGVFTNGKAYRLSDASLTDSLLRVHFYGTNLSGTNLPENTQDITGIAVLQRGKYYIAPRFMADIVPSGSSPEPTTFFAMFTVSDKENLTPIEGAVVSCNNVESNTDVTGLTALELPLNTNLTYSITHDEYKDLGGSFSATKDTSLNLYMEEKLSDEDLETNTDKVSAHTYSGRIYLSGTDYVDGITIYSLTGVPVYKSNSRIEVGSWSYNAEDRGLYLVRIQKGSKVWVSKVVVMK